MESDQANAAVPGKTVGVILCAGQGSRMGAAGNKIFLPVAGKPLLDYALATFDRAPEIAEILLVAHPNEVEYFTATFLPPRQFHKPVAVIAGGATRHQSEYQALQALRPRIISGAITSIAIHDGARPFVTDADIARLLAASRRVGGALLATPVPAAERIAVVQDGVIQRALPSDELYRAQTPQAFAARDLLAAYDQAARDGFEGTDTAASFARAGFAVQVVPCAATNIKVTTPDDLALAEYLARDIFGA